MTTTINPNYKSIFPQFVHIELGELPKFKTYRLMYLWGAWVPVETLAAEDDAEAIFDADMIEKKALGKLRYALFEGNRLVKEY